MLVYYTNQNNCNNKTPGVLKCIHIITSITLQNYNLLITVKITFKTQTLKKVKKKKRTVQRVKIIN